MEITTQAPWRIPIKASSAVTDVGRGGDVIRFAELYHQVKFPQAVALLR
jgi:hypothetical protein